MIAEDKEDVDALAAEPIGMADAYAHGECHILASVLSEITGWPIQAAIFEDSWTGRGNLVHAWIRLPDGKAFDARGISDPDDLLDHYPSGDEATVWTVTEEVVMKLGSGRKAVSKKKRDLAETFAIDLLEKNGISLESVHREFMRG